MAKMICAVASGASAVPRFLETLERCARFRAGFAHRCSLVLHALILRFHHGGSSGESLSIVVCEFLNRRLTRPADIPTSAFRLIAWVAFRAAGCFLLPHLPQDLQPALPQAPKC